MAKKTMIDNKDNESIYEYDFSDNILSKQQMKNIYKIQKRFLDSYVSHKDMPVEQWLTQELQEQLPERSNEEINTMSVEIIESLKITEEKKEDLQKAVAKGRNKENWFASTLIKSTSNMSVQESARYLNSLDEAVKNANEAMQDTITTKAGLPNQNMNLDGFIAEQYHVNTYNMKAKVLGSDLHAEVLKPKPGETYAKNSVDIVIKDSNGKIISRYQSKYGKTAEDTIRMIKEGDYRGQQLVVPEEQVEAVQKAFPNRKVSGVIGEGEITSKQLAKEKSKQLQEEAQKGNFLDTNWNEYTTKDLAVGIGKQTGYACLQGAVIGAGMNIASKALNGEEIDGGEVIETAITSGADFGVKTATAGALKVASEKGVLSIKGSGNTFANIAFVAVENVKVMGKVATGELTVKEGIDTMQQTTMSCVAGITASAKGTAIGATIGSVLGPVGTAVGGFIGGTVGYIAGSKFGQTIAKGYQKVRDTAVSFVKSTVSKVASGFKSFASGLASLFSF